MIAVNYRTTFVAALAAALAAPRPAAATDSIESLEDQQTALYERIAPSVALLSRAGATGSGFFVAPDAIVTNAHVVGDARAVNVVVADGRMLRGEVERIAAGGLDLALVRVPLADGRALSLASPDALRPGSFVATVGHGAGSAASFAVGLVASVRPLGRDVPLIQAQLPLRPGSSGAPVVDRAGRVVGVVTAGAKDASGLVFAIRADVVARELGIALGEGSGRVASAALPVGAAPQ